MKRFWKNKKARLAGIWWMGMAMAYADDSPIPLPSTDQINDNQNFIQDIKNIFQQDVIPFGSLIVGSIMAIVAIGVLLHAMAEFRETRNIGNFVKYLLFDAFCFVIGATLLYVFYNLKSFQG